MKKIKPKRVYVRRTAPAKTPPTQCRYKCICGATFELWWDFEAHDCKSNKNLDKNQ